MQTHFRWLVTLAAMVAPLTIAVSSAGENGVDHSPFSQLLAEHVVDGVVNYDTLAKARGGLVAYLETLAEVDPAALDSWAKERQLAFWINAYNAQVLDIVLEHRPLKRRGLLGLRYPGNSVQQIPGIWKEQKRVIAGEARGLDDIEHGIIRPQFDEPRIHFALVCAALSCPPLRAEAYTPSALDRQLQDQTRQFLSNSEKGVRHEADRERVLVSSIFKWFAEDFGGAAGVREFVAAAGPEDIRRALADEDTSLGYLSYDWTLNSVSESTSDPR